VHGSGSFAWGDKGWVFCAFGWMTSSPTWEMVEYESDVVIFKIPCNKNKMIINIYYHYKSARKL
jgi:hypothetical protein